MALSVLLFDTGSVPVPNLLLSRKDSDFLELCLLILFMTMLLVPRDLVFSTNDRLEVGPALRDTRLLLFPLLTPPSSMLLSMLPVLCMLARSPTLALLLRFLGLPIMDFPLGVFGRRPPSKSSMSLSSFELPKK